MAQSHFDPDRYKWRHVTGEPGLSYQVRHDYTILGYALAAGTLDMVVRWAGDGGPIRSGPDGTDSVPPGSTSTAGCRVSRKYGSRMLVTTTSRMPMIQRS